MSREVPKDWETVSLNMVVDHVTEKWEPGEARQPYVGLEHIGQGTGTLVGIASSADVQSAKTQFRPGDILFGKLRPNLRKTAFVDFSGVASTDILILRPRGMTPEFAFYRLSSEEVFEHAIRSAAGTKMPRTSWKDMAEFSFHLPPLHEQRRIAEILSSVDDAIAATRAVIEQTRKVKQGVLERLLTKGIGHTRFKQTEIGEIPEGWRIGTLGSITLGLEAGVSVNSENRPKQPGEIGILKTSCVSAGIFDPREHKTVLPGEHHRVKTPVVGDRIIISRMNTPNLVGANGYVENDIGDLFLPDRLWQLSTSENARWLAYLLASDRVRQRLSAIATGTSGSMKNISKSKLVSLLFAIPSPAEQQQIASMVKEIDASIEENSQTLKGQIVLKAALMSDLLTGRKRVTDALPMAAE